MERALLEGEQQIQLEQLDSAREKVAALEAKESKLLAESAAERSKVRAVFNETGYFQSNSVVTLILISSFSYCNVGLRVKIATFYGIHASQLISKSTSF